MEDEACRRGLGPRLREVRGVNMSAATDNLRSNQRQLDMDGCEVGVSRQAVEETLAEVEHLRAWVSDLQSGMYVNCVYCGHRYGPGETTPVSMADALKAHIAQCPEHPMSGLLKACTAASNALKSYAYGNASTELARDVAKFVDAAIIKVGGKVTLS